jgi:hypothetical protein
MSKGYALVIHYDEVYHEKVSYWIFKNCKVSDYQKAMKAKEQNGEPLFFVKGTLIDTNGWREPHNGSFSFGDSFLIRCRNKTTLGHQLMKYLL